MTRRQFIMASAAGWAATLRPSALFSQKTALPRDNPAAALQIGWTNRLAWGRVLDVTTQPGTTWEQRLEAAQARLAAEGGGVVFFPPGEYVFTETLRLKSGIVIRGAAPPDGLRAVDQAYTLPTRFEFPRYRPKLEGSGTPIETAFRGIVLEDPATAANCGVVHVAFNHGHIHLGEGPQHRCGTNRLVLGCVLRNAARADPRVPDLALGQHAWQRFTHGHAPAISVHAAENLLIAGNRLPASDASFTMPGYVLKARQKGVATVAYDVVFDYDNRPGIAANPACVGAPGGQSGRGTPEQFPWGFRRGAVIRDNYVYCTGRTAIALTGDGTVCVNNVIRFPRDIWRPTNTGLHETSGSSTNDNRAVEMRGWRWVVEGNDYEVWRNWAADRKYYINDGEGLMHEHHCNASIRDSRLVNNRGNAYLSLYLTEGIDGLLVEGNEVAVDRGYAIFVNANLSRQVPAPCRRVTIARNVTRGGGILIAGQPAGDNVVRDNRHLGPPAPLRNEAAAQLADNENYEVVAG